MISYSHTGINFPVTRAKIDNLEFDLISIVSIIMARSFDYSKWDNIELSDDESDLHPNIDKESWFRLKHRTRIEREEKEDQEIKEYEKKSEENQARINIIRARMNAAATAADGDEENDAQYEDLDALQIELKELTDQIAKRNKRIAEIADKRQWNIDNICKVKEEKTIVNEIQAKSLKSDPNESFSNDDEDLSASNMSMEDVVEGPAKSGAAASTAVKASTMTTTTTGKGPVSSSSTSAPSTAVTNKGAEPAGTMKRERMAIISYNDYAVKHERILERYSEIEDLEATKEYLFKNCDILLHEHAQSYMLLSCLEDEMNGKHKRMKLVCRQSQIISHIHELGTSMKRDPRDVILPFFKRISEAEYYTGFLSAVDDFTKKIQKRAVEKRKEMDLERANEEVEFDEDSAPLGPGGLNPVTVLKNMPKSLREAFESQQMDRLQDVLGRMDAVEAKYWMKQCVDAGLWVAKDPTIFEDDSGGPASESIQEGDNEETEAVDEDQPPPLEA